MSPIALLVCMVFSYAIGYLKGFMRGAVGGKGKVERFHFQGGSRHDVIYKQNDKDQEYRFETWRN